MEYKLHPTHARTTRFTIIILIIIAITEWAVGMGLTYIYGRYGVVENIWAGLWVLLIISVIAVGFLRRKLCRCPACKKWLTKKVKLPEVETIVFVCADCEISWDTGISEDK